MYSIYQDALLQREKVSICGIKIGDLTVAQNAVLWAMENPFVFSVKGNFAQFCTCLVVLQKKYPFNDYENWVKESLILGKRIQHGTLWHKKLITEQLEEEQDTLIDYFKFHSKTHPRGFPPGKGNKTPVIPWQYNVVFSIRRYFHESDINTWNMPLLRAMCYHSTICHNLGDDTLYNDMQCEMRDENIEEEIKKEKSNG